MRDAAAGQRDIDKDQQSRVEERKKEATSKETLNQVQEKEEIADAANQSGAPTPVLSPDGEPAEKDQEKDTAGPM